MANVLITSARTSGCLELARQLHSAGNTVCVAESFRNHICRGSRAVARDFLVPSASRETDEYINALSRIVDTEHIDYLVPTCEEVLFIALHRNQLESRCQLVMDDVEKLLTLHDKWRFTELMQELHLKVPASRLLTSKDAIESALRDHETDMLVLKPAYSRFAARTVLRPGPETDFSVINPTPAEPWIAQRFIEGRELATYSIACKGRLTAHVTYPVRFRLGDGPTVVYAPIDHAESLRCANVVADALSFSGQFGLDFIETRDGELFAIECNPRTTGGVHCFEGTPEFQSAILGEFVETLTPTDMRPRMYTSLMLTSILWRQRSWQQLWEWAQTFRAGRGIIFRFNDPRTLYQQFGGPAYFMRLARREKITFREATTWDIAFEGVNTAEYASTPYSK